MPSGQVNLTYLISGTRRSKADFTAGNVCGYIERTGTVVAFTGGRIIMIACDSFVVFRAFMECFSENY